MDYNDPLRRDGRAVECTGLENQQALIGLPGFESLSLRHLKPLKIRTLKACVHNCTSGDKIQANKGF